MPALSTSYLRRKVAPPPPPPQKQLSENKKQKGIPKKRLPRSGSHQSTSYYQGRCSGPKGQNKPKMQHDCTN